MSKIFGSNVSSSTFIMCPLISSCFPKIPSKVVKASLGVLQEDMWKRISREMSLQIVLNASSIRFRYLDFSMSDVGCVSVFIFNLYNPLPQGCIIIFSFHAKKLYGVIMNSFGNSIFTLSSIFGTCKNNLVCLFPSSLSNLIPCKCDEIAHNRSI